MTKQKPSLVSNAKNSIYYSLGNSFMYVKIQGSTFPIYFIGFFGDLFFVTYFTLSYITYFIPYFSSKLVRINLG